MKSAKHEILKEQWKEMIKDHKESGLPIRKWCEQNHISHGQYYYWLKIIREDALIKAGTLAVTGQTQFVEIKEQKNNNPTYSNNQECCAILRSNGNEIEIFNGANPNTLEAILKILGSL